MVVTVVWRPPVWLVATDCLVHDVVEVVRLTLQAEVFAVRVPGVMEDGVEAAAGCVATPERLTEARLIAGEAALRVAEALAAVGFCAFSAAWEPAVPAARNLLGSACHGVIALLCAMLAGVPAVPDVATAPAVAAGAVAWPQVFHPW
jgi:hypothetical protein